MVPALVAAIFITSALLLLLRPIAVNIGLVDRPSLRKTHDSEVPLIGGIAMIIGLTLSMLLLPTSLESYRILFFGIGVLAVVGALDDRHDVSPKAKIIVQFAVATTLVSLDTVSVLHIGDIFARDYPVYLGPLREVLTIIAIVGVINAVNMIDGLDGLAASISIAAFGAIAVLLVISGRPGHIPLLALVLTVLFVFLVFNLEWLVGKSRQVFMGDAGSMVIGLILAYFLIVSSTGGKPPLRVTSAPWIIGLPLLDLFGVLALRTLNKTPLYKADRLHIHHLLLDSGMSKTIVLFLLVGIQGLFCMVGILGSVNFWPDWTMFWVAIAITVAYVFLRMKFSAPPSIAQRK